MTDHETGEPLQESRLSGRTVASSRSPLGDISASARIALYTYLTLVPVNEESIS